MMRGPSWIRVCCPLREWRGAWASATGLTAFGTAPALLLSREAHCPQAKSGLPLSLHVLLGLEHCSTYSCTGWKAHSALRPHVPSSTLTPPQGSPMTCIWTTKAGLNSP